MLQALKSLPALGRAARSASDWVDLQWSLVVELLARVAPQAHGRLLDVGCGDKPYEHLFTPYVSEYLGIEHEASFSATSASHANRGPDMLYDGRRLPFADRSFDTVLNVQVLEHTPHPAALVAEMARVLKDDGVLLLSAPFQFRLHEQPHDYYRYSPHGLRVLCAAAGLEVVEVHNQGSLWSVLAHKLNSYLAFRVARVGGLAQAMGKLPHEGRAQASTRLWTLPLVAPLMLGLAGSARVLDRIAPDDEEALGFLIVARRKKMLAAGALPAVRSTAEFFPDTPESS
ncbi:MAG: class I SAM-dependent methyltransferase [Polyangiaceae bacterium]